VVLGLGLATLVPDTASPPSPPPTSAASTSRACSSAAGTTNSQALVQVGPAGSSATHASDPIELQDVFFRVGGDVAGKATQSLVVNSPDTIGSDNWIWRADHGNGGTVGWSTNNGPPTAP